MENLKIEYVKKTKCDICNSENLEKEFVMNDFDTNLGEFELLKCKNCGMYYTSPYPSAKTLPNLYENIKTRNFDLKNNFIIEILKDFLAKKQIKKFTKSLKILPKKILDFGSGNCRFSCMCQEIFNNSQVYAVDFPKDKPIRLKEKKFNSISYIHTDEFYCMNEKFDLILLRHVLEHSENPLTLLNTLAEKLTDDGLLIIETPNINNGISKWFKKISPSFFPPYHIVHFTKENLALILSKTKLNYNITQSEMPIMSNFVANYMKTPLNSKLQFLGIILHPMQLFANMLYGEKTVLIACCQKKLDQK